MVDLSRKNIKIIRGTVVVIMAMAMVILFSLHVSASINYNYNNGTLSVSGTGKMPVYNSDESEDNEAPWKSYETTATKIIISEGVESISKVAFAHFSKVNSVVIADSVKIIEQGAFEECTNLTSINLGNGVEKIEDYAFQRTAESVIAIPTSLQQIDFPMAFFENDKLETITINENNGMFTAVNNVVYNKNRTSLLFYLNNNRMISFTVPTSVKTIESQAFRDNKYIQNIILQNGLIALGDWCFYGVSNLKTINLPDTVASIGDGIFEECTSLSSVSTGNGITSTSHRMFFGCTSLVSVSLGSNVTELDLRTFYNCSSLESLVLPTNLEKIKVYAFFGCSKLKNMIIPNSVTYIQAGAFEGCTLFKPVYPTQLTLLDNGDYAIVNKIKITVNRDYKKAYEVLTLVNKERKAVGLPELKMDMDLLEAAMERAGEISIFFDHTRPNGMGCFSISEKVYGENIAAGQSTASGTMNSWMNSSGHKANILGIDFQSIGIGCVEINGMTYWTQAFGYYAAKVGSKPSNETKEQTIQVGTAITGYYNAGKKSINVGKEEKIVTELVNAGWSYSATTINNDSFNWMSSNTAYATVSTKGVVTAKKAGVVTITAFYKGTNTIAYTSKITCKVAAEDVNKIDANGNLIKVSKAKIAKKEITKGKVKLTFKSIKKARYQIKVSRNKKFSKPRVITVKTNKCTIKKLIKNKKYYIKVRAYKLNSSNKRVYGKYSNVLVIKAK